MPPLRETLHHRQMDALVADAELIANWTVGTERLSEAERLVRKAMLHNTLGRITQAELSRIYAILSFALPGGSAATNESATKEPSGLANANR